MQAIRTLYNAGYEANSGIGETLLQHGTREMIVFFLMGSLHLNGEMHWLAAKLGHTEYFVIMQELAVAAPHMAPAGFLHSGLCKVAAKGRHMQTLRHLHAIGCPWDYETPREAANNNDIPMLSYLHDRGCDLDTYGYVCALVCRRIQVVEFVQEAGLVQIYRDDIRFLLQLFLTLVGVILVVIRAVEKPIFTLDGRWACYKNA